MNIVSYLCVCVTGFVLSSRAKKSQSVREYFQSGLERANARLATVACVCVCVQYGVPQGS